VPLLRRLGDRLTLANLLSTACLALLLGGGTAAALTGRDRVNSGDIKNNRVKGVDIGDGEVKGRDVADGAIVPSVQRRLPAARITDPQEGCAPEVIDTGAPEALRFSAEDFDPGGLHPDSADCDAPSTRMFAPRDGVYEVGAGVHWPSNSLGARTLSLRADESDLLASETRDALPSGETLQAITATVRLHFDDRVEAVVEQTSGAPLQLAGGADNNYMTMVWIGP
jgi:hypothetical protein